MIGIDFYSVDDPERYKFVAWKSNCMLPWETYYTYLVGFLIKNIVLVAVDKIYKYLLTIITFSNRQ
jgi:hypothetical protein